MRTMCSWGSLELEAARLGLIPLAKMATVKELEEKVDEKLDRSEAIKSLVEEANGEWTDELKAEWTAIMDEEKGELTALGKELQAARKFEGEIKRQATMRLARERGGSNPLRGTDLDLQTGDANPGDMIDAGENFNYFHGRLNAFQNSARGRKDARACAMFFRALISRHTGDPDEEAVAYCEKHEIQMVATEGDSGSGGYNVPEPAESAWLERRENVGVMSGLADGHIMTAESLTVPKLLSGPAITYPGETGSGTASDQVWGQVKLTANERMFLTYISNRLKSDAAINVVDQFLSRAAYEAAKQDDNEAINGDSTSTYGRETGLLAALGAAGKATAAAGHDTWPELDLADHLAAMALLPDDFWDNPVWLCSVAYYHAVMLRIQASAGGNTIATLEAGGSARPLFLGRPVYFTGRMRRTTAVSTVSCLFGTFSRALMKGTRQGLQVATSEHVRFTSNQFAIRGVYRQDWLVHEGGDASNAGAYVGLSTSS